MTGAKLISLSRGNGNPPSNEKPTVIVTNCPAIDSAKARLINRRYPEHLERNEHKSIEDLHEDISCSVDVKNPQANFNDLENSVPPEESNDDLLDQAWDDHTGES